MEPVFMYCVEIHSKYRRVPSLSLNVHEKMT